jgi:hypothetical protein
MSSHEYRFLSALCNVLRDTRSFHGKLAAKVSLPDQQGDNGAGKQRVARERMPNCRRSVGGSV